MRKNANTEYEIVVKSGPSGSKEHGDFGWASIKTYFRIGRWDADMKAGEERRLNPAADVSVFLCASRRVGESGL